MEKKEGKSKKGRWKIENGRRKNYKMRRGFFFIIFFFYYYSLFFLFYFIYLFIYLFIFSFHLSKPLKFILGLPKWEFSTRKKHFTLEKQFWKNDFAPSKKYSSYAPRKYHQVYSLLLVMACAAGVWKFHIKDIQSPAWGQNIYVCAPSLRFKITN